MDWYVARDGETFGPFPFEVMIKGIRDGELTPQDLVWSQDAQNGNLPRVFLDCFRRHPYPHHRR